MRQVWADNLETEFAAMRAAIDQYPYVSMVRAPLQSAECQESEAQRRVEG